MGKELVQNNMQQHGDCEVLKNSLNDQGKEVREENIYFKFILNIAVTNFDVTEKEKQLFQLTLPKALANSAYVTVIVQER